MNALFAPRAKGGRLLAVFALALLLAAPAVLLWAEKIQKFETPGEDDSFEATLLEQAARRMAGEPLPFGEQPPLEFAPFGAKLSPRIYEGDAAVGKLLTPLGHTSWDRAQDDLLAQVPVGLRLQDSELDQAPGRVIATEGGLHYVKLAPGVGPAAAGALGKVVGVLPDATFLMYMDPLQAMQARHSSDIEQVRAMDPAYKIMSDVGVRSLINRHEVNNPNIKVYVQVVPGMRTPELTQMLQATPGISEVTENPFENTGYTLRVNYHNWGDLTRIKQVLSVSPDYEYMLENAENPATIETGSSEDGLLIRPFMDAGVDGGGIDTNLDGKRINNGTDTVPPQIVGVGDNGISADTPNFSQNATQVAPFPTSIGPSHRKIHAIHNIEDGGTSCDSPLSGAQTHGTITAGTIAAYPSELGFFATRSGIGGSGQPRQALLDGLARGARIIMQDMANTTRCTVSNLVEKGGEVNPGNLASRLNLFICPKSGGAGSCLGYTGGADEIHLAVYPFGAPDNFSTNPNLASNGTYPQQAADIDTFLYNNKDFMLMMPVGNNGFTVGTNRLGLAQRVIPDLFNGTAADDVDANNNPLPPQPIQIASPSTAKNLVAVGASTDDCWTFFGSTDCEQAIANFTSRGPATPASLRMAPLVTAPAFDLTGSPQPLTSGVAVFRSNDNDNLAPIDAQLDESNFGTSYAASYMAGAGAIIRDYFAQGFFPTGSRTTANRVPNVSGALVKAALAASADFNEAGIGTQGQDVNERELRRTRCLIMPSPVDLMCNSEQGYGRAVLTQVLPLANWSNDHLVHPLSGSPFEFPAAGLLAWDHFWSGEPLIDNSTTSVTHQFSINSPRTIVTLSGGTAVRRSQLRIAAAWIDIPSPAGSGGPLVNDLDLVLESPGPDNCLDTTGTQADGVTLCSSLVDPTADNLFYAGNNYNGGTNNASRDQWSLSYASGAPLVHEFRNPQEAIHLSSDPNNDGIFTDSSLYVGKWRLTVQRGLGGASPGTITILAGSSEDANSNGRLDPGEDTVVVNGLLDLPGQPYALVVAGPVFLDEAAPSAGPSNFPLSTASFSRLRYTCADNAVLNILDTTLADPSASALANTTYEVLDTSGAVIDTESGFAFTNPAPNVASSAGLPVRLGDPPAVNNGILDAETGYTIVATYAPGGQAAVSASAPVQCTPDLINASFIIGNADTFGPQYAINNGCDQDEHFDAGEVVTYGVALQNRSRTDDYADVTASLTASGPGAAALKVLDSPKNIGRFPGSSVNSVFFHVFVDPVLANALPVADRKVTMELSLNSLFKGVKLARQSYSFEHAINSDTEELFYSTDLPDGGRAVRDLNRNLVIDPPNTIDPTLGFILPPEDVTFSTMFVANSLSGNVSNREGEDFNLNGIFDGQERDIVPDGLVNKGILALAVPSAGDLVPWSFDDNDGGWKPFRHPGSTPGSLAGGSPMWEHKASLAAVGAGYAGQCGFQTANGASKYGIWHTGDANDLTPGGAATACDVTVQPNDGATPAKIETVFDVLESPIIAKVNQQNDARGFPYVVEFQRLGLNLNIQTYDGYAGGAINIDNDVEVDGTNCLLCQQVDTYYLQRAGGWPYVVFRFQNQYTGGVDSSNFQRVFGNFVNPDGSGTLNGDEKGFVGIESPQIPSTGSGDDYKPFPLPGECCATVNPDLTCADVSPSGIPCYDSGDCSVPTPICVQQPRPGVCDPGSPNPGHPCQPFTEVADCGAAATCTLADTSVAGPVRNYDTTLVGFEGGQAASLNEFPPDNYYFSISGKASNRWQIGIGYWAIESVAGTTDYGFGIDDPVFEWKEYHPVDESAFVPPHLPACDRFGLPGEAAGGQCATLTADRGTLYECDEGMVLTVYDAKCVGTAPSATLGKYCEVDADCTAPENCTADDPSVTVEVVTDTDSTQGVGGALAPSGKLFTLNRVDVGVFEGTVIFSTTTDDDNHVFTIPGTESSFAVYYHDPLCDGDVDGAEGEESFDNLDGDNIPAGADNCPELYNPGQADADGDAIGDPCDNCPDVFNPGQDDIDADDVGDDCDYDDLDLDGADNFSDTCPDVFGSVCSTFEYGLCGGVGLCDTGGSNTCIEPLYKAGEACTTDADCDDPGRCHAGLEIVDGNPQNMGWACSVDSDCDWEPDRDADGVIDRLDNCVLTPNGSASGGGVCGTGNCDAGGSNTCLTGYVGIACAVDADCDRPGRCTEGWVGNRCSGDSDCDLISGATTQADDADGDGIGDACDGDVGGAALLFLCRDNPSVLCGGGPACDPSCATDSATEGVPGCAFGDGTKAYGACVPYVRGSGTASETNDDFDIDGVEDSIDNCPSVQNFPIIPNTDRQEDTDRDGLGNACDPEGTNDDENDGIPDDLVVYNGNVACKSPALNLANLTVLSSAYVDDGCGLCVGGVCEGASPNSGAACAPDGHSITCGLTYPSDGDCDAFPDTAEEGTLSVTVNNAGVALTDVTLIASTADSDVACITQPSVVVPGGIAAGATVTVTGFRFKASNSLESLPPPGTVADIIMNITVVANETLGVQSPVNLKLLADLNAPPGVTQVFTKGPDGLANTGDDGITVETFDIDRDGNGEYTIDDVFLQATAPGVYKGHCNTLPSATCDTAADCLGFGVCGGGGTCTAPPATAAAGQACGTDADCDVLAGDVNICYGGEYIFSSATGVGLNVVAGITCGGMDDPGTTPQCQLLTGLDPEGHGWMDWHFHCPIGATNCKNLESGPTGNCGTLSGTTGKTCYNTAGGSPGGHHYTSAPNSLHMGAHFDLTDNLAGDTTHFRALQGFQSAPVNLALFPRSGDLELAMYHITRLMDNNGVGPGNERQCVDCADVQIQIDANPDKDIDEWGFWDKLVPFQNVYDHKVQAWSVFGGYYCEFTPTDTGSAPPSPKGVQETLCYPLGAWSHCGSTIGTTAATTVNCAGSAEDIVDVADGTGVWARTKFNLAGFLGQRVRIRWIAESWHFGEGPSSPSYYEIGPGWGDTQQDDGWWLDDISITGTVEQQVTPEPDTIARSGSCPADKCDETLAGTDNGTNVTTVTCAGTCSAGGRVGQSCSTDADCPVLKATDLNGNVYDFINTFPITGQDVRISAIDATIPGGCVDGVAEYEFSKAGEVVQAFGPKTYFQDGLESPVIYTVRARCSTDFTCTSDGSGSILVGPYTGGDGGDTLFAKSGSPFNVNNGVQYDRNTQETTLSVFAPGNNGVDFYRGTIGPGSVPPDTSTIRGTLNSATDWRLNGAKAAASCMSIGSGAITVLENVTGTCDGASPNPGDACSVNGDCTPGLCVTNFPAVTSGALDQAQDPDPAVGSVVFYIATRNTPANFNRHGCANPRVCVNDQTVACSKDADCSGVGGICALVNLPKTYNGCPNPSGAGQSKTERSVTTLCN